MTNMHNIPESLPLFSDLEPVRDVKRVVRDRSLQRDRSLKRDRSLNHHLRAARRLSRVVRKHPDHSREQTRAGQAICRHLIALLEEAGQESAGAIRKNG
ncbi:MAG: hypothetical protein O7F71_22365 [Gammaproteobacteria bacterium]|nr:hypothetical protein [Gammaproteobacteria bacterium]